MNTYKFTISKEHYSSKPEVKFITWLPKSMSVEDMYNHVLSGYTITGDYGFSEEFKIGRTKDNWKGSQFLYIGLDGVDIDWNVLNVKLNNSSIVW